MITNIAIDRLFPHPANPRKNLGDLTELAESIKAKGVLQNLTVVPQESGYCPSCTNFIPSSARQCKRDDTQGERPPCSKWESQGNYTVIIGHRRLAAAKLAGLTELPCVVADMDKREQVATMLLENIQRVDLTVYEQAQGFQMMLNLGETVNGISQKTGFSETTVRHRVKLMELDQEKFQQAVTRGGRLEDYIALNKITDAKSKNKVLEFIGTRDFEWKLKTAIDEQEMPVRKKELIDWLKDWAKPVKQSGNNMNYEHGFYGYKLDNFKMPKDAGKVEYFYVDNGNSITLYKKSVLPEKKKATAQELAFKHREAKLKELTERAYGLRYDFIKAFNASQKHSDAIAALAVKRMIRYGGCDLDDMLKMLDIDMPADTSSYSDIQGLKRKMLLDKFEERPWRVMLVTAYLSLGDSKGTGYHYSRSWNNEISHQGNETLDAIYDCLIALGYEPSTEEQQLRDGTHELFQATS